MWKEKLKHGLSVHFGIQMIHRQAEIFKFNENRLFVIFISNSIWYGSMWYALPVGHVKKCELSLSFYLFLHPNLM